MSRPQVLLICLFSLVFAVVGFAKPDPVRVFYRIRGQAEVFGPYPATWERGGSDSAVVNWELPAVEKSGFGKLWAGIWGESKPVRLNVGLRGEGIADANVRLTSSSAAVFWGQDSKGVWVPGRKLNDRPSSVEIEFDDTTARLRDYRVPIAILQAPRLGNYRRGLQKGPTGPETPLDEWLEDPAADARGIVAPRWQIIEVSRTDSLLDFAGAKSLLEPSLRNPVHLIVDDFGEMRLALFIAAGGRDLYVAPGELALPLLSDPMSRLPTQLLATHEIPGALARFAMEPESLLAIAADGRRRRDEPDPIQISPDSWLATRKVADVTLRGAPWVLGENLKYAAQLPYFSDAILETIEASLAEAADPATVFWKTPDIAKSCGQRVGEIASVPPGIYPPEKFHR